MQGVAITIEGLDSNYDLISEVVTMDASDTTTVQETTTNFYRIVKATVTGTNTNSIPNDYDITFKYGSSGGTTVAKILATYGATQSCTYTVPAGYQAFILAVNGSSGQSDEITTMIWDRPFNGAWSQVKTFKFVSGTFEHNMRTPLVFDEKTDIEIRAYALVESSRIGTEFQLLLVPNVT
jgi:phage-related protein